MFLRYSFHVAYTISLQTHIKYIDLGYDVFMLAMYFESVYHATHLDLSVLHTLIEGM